ncbi:MAG: hypothetical protein F4Y62_12620 [Rhodospirillaceae bacterium]|nr:hypothetical protein [Rhodospirillaceae bacterium]MYK14501.1 hypothetical protein [Rhodospirillaceae bacterium]
MTLAVPVILLARSTTGHDWYAARTLTVAEAMLAAGFSKTTTVAYRRADGVTWNIIRAAVVVFPSAVKARRRILAAIGDGVMLGAGVGGTVFCLMLLGAAGQGRRGRPGTALEPVDPAHRHFPAAGPAGRIAEWVRPGLRARVALLVVSPAELERLLTLPGHGRRAGFVDLPGPDGAKPAEAGGELLERTETPSLPPTGSHNRRAQAAVPAKPAPADPGSGPDNPKPDDSTGGKTLAPKREPGAQFF